ncbi:mitochondrial intermembrane space import and assembly protein 40-A-like [Actinia tenebrosa]|uniref:Mitochondrial intermembrane space import and assembly protein 40-A-like n=1 Tax=Actinia tenebrosa TaxID=6105 RepID=A0A6P8J0Z3_ACTTE|nr:mitochondrial intermembrane space import and assembly protein 40-A-like [Actinia tenebrosa]
MSYCREEGKDKLIFATEDDYSTPSNVVFVEDDDDYEGLIKPTGEINWDCPCLQGMADGPCGEQFKAAFSCFHYSEAEAKGADCVPQFRDMQMCFSKYPDIYGKEDEETSEKNETISENLDGTDSEVESNTQQEESKSTDNEIKTTEGGSEEQNIKADSSS